MLVNRVHDVGPRPGVDGADANDSLHELVTPKEEGIPSRSEPSRRMPSGDHLPASDWKALANECDHKRRSG